MSARCLAKILMTIEKAGGVPVDKILLQEQAVVVDGLVDRVRKTAATGAGQVVLAVTGKSADLLIK